MWNGRLHYRNCLDSFPLLMRKTKTSLGACLDRLPITVRTKSHAKENTHHSHALFTFAFGNQCSHAPMGRFIASRVPDGALATASRLCHGYSPDWHTSKDDRGKRKRHDRSRSQRIEWKRLSRGKTRYIAIRRRRQLLLPHFGVQRSVART